MEGQKAKEPKAWDRRPWPPQGDLTADIVYLHVGYALSQWERYEGVLSILFGHFLSVADTRTPQRAYSAVRTFEGRAEMLKAVSEAYFEMYPAKELQNTFKDLIKRSLSFAPRRNEIAHGAVSYYFKEGHFAGLVHGPDFALFPSYASFRERALNNEPTYCMTSTELSYFSAQFQEMQTPAINIINALRNDETRKPSLQRLYEPDPPSANPHVDQMPTPKTETPPKS